MHPTFEKIQKEMFYKLKWKIYQFSGKTIKSPLSVKIVKRGKTNLFEKGKCVKTELETVEVLNIVIKCYFLWLCSEWILL